MIPRNLLDYLEATARRTPDKVAFADEKRAFSFAELEKRARVLGTRIAETAGPERKNVPVGVFVTRSAAALPAMLAALEAGCFYVPLDRSMPVPRMTDILTRLQPVLCIDAGADEGPLPFAPDCPVLDADADGTENAALLAERRAIDADPAYLIFTSGSTGSPKGIVVSHRAAIDFAEWLTGHCRYNEKDVLANQAPFFFDLSFKDLCTALKTGATVQILPRQLFSFPLKLAEALTASGVTALNWATSAFNLLADSGALGHIKAPLRVVTVGGEALRPRALGKWQDAFPAAHFINLYGPTEVTVDCTYYDIERRFGENEEIPIGRACPNMEVLLLDGNQPAADGSTGEICVRGSGLAHGYYHDPERTAAVFVQNPLRPEYPDILYRTGDIAVRGTDGLLYFRSRADGQVKHMGYRIELGEIENAMAALDGVEASACAYDRNAGKIVCFYEGSRSGRELSVQLRQRLPKYMLPNRMVQHPLPRLANGKIDRAALAAGIADGSYLELLKANRQ